MARPCALSLSLSIYFSPSLSLSLSLSLSHRISKQRAAREQRPRFGRRINEYDARLPVHAVAFVYVSKDVDARPDVAFHALQQPFAAPA